MPLIRKNPKASNGLSGGDIDVALQLFGRRVLDGNVASKASRDHLVEQGYAVRFRDGTQTLSRKGVAAFFLSPVMLRCWLRQLVRRAIRAIRALRTAPPPTAGREG